MTSAILLHADGKPLAIERDSITRIAPAKTMWPNRDSGSVVYLGTEEVTRQTFWGNYKTTKEALYLYVDEDVEKILNKASISVTSINNPGLPFS